MYQNMWTRKAFILMKKKCDSWEREEGWSMSTNQCEWFRERERDIETKQETKWERKILRQNKRQSERERYWDREIKKERERYI